MALDHDGTARGQRRRRVAACDREGERKVGRAEDRHRPDGPLHQPQVRPRQGAAVGQRGVVAPVEIRARLDMIGEEPQLADGAAPFALQPGLGQAGLPAADPGDLLAAGVDLLCDAAQEGGPLGPAGPAVGPEGILGRLGRAIDERHGPGGELLRLPLGGFRQERRVAAGPGAGDQVFAVQRHARSSREGPWPPGCASAPRRRRSTRGSASRD